MKNILIFISLIFSSAANASDRVHKDFSPKSPEAAAFDRVSDIPVSNYTGNLNLSIPLFTIENGDLQLPVSLDYQGTAIRVDQEATWVGLNWLLNAGGAITTRLAASHQSNSLSPGDIKEDWNHLLKELSFRKVYPNGGDLNQQVPYKINGMHPDWRGSYGQNWFPRPFVVYENRNNYNDLSYNLYNLILNYDEGESPTFHAAFMGNSFTFIWDRMKEEFFITGNKKNFKIDGKPGQTITVTDGNGIVYRFWVTEIAYPDGTEIHDNMRNIDYTYYLSQIISPSGKKITLNYTDNGSCHPVRKVSETLYDNNVPSSFIKGENLKELVGDQKSVLGRSISQYYVINSKRLFSITTDDAVVKFNVDAGLRKDINGDSHQLNSIELYKKISDNKQQLVKRFCFRYSYFAKNESGGNTLKDYLKEMSAGSDLYNSWYPDDSFMYMRLKLDQVWEETTDADNVVYKKPAYKFYYNGSLPCKASAAIDYWGYYNGKENYNGKYHTQIPKNWYSDTDDNVYEFPDTYKSVCADRRPDETYASAGMLISVDYPTGGKASFKYEAHSFGNFKYLDSKRTAFTDRSFNRTTVYVCNNPGYSNPDATEKEKTVNISEDAVLDLQISYVKSDQKYKSTWRNMLTHVLLIKKYGYIYNQSGQHEIVKSATGFTLSPQDTLNTSGCITKTHRIELESGKYSIEISPFDKTTYQESFYQITATLDNANRKFMSKGAGVRLKSITYTDDNSSTVTEYNYNNDDGYSSGLLMSPVIFSRQKLLIYQNDNVYTDENSGTSFAPVPPKEISYRILCNNNLVPGQSVQVGYSKVTETCTGGTDRNGSKVYIYWNKRWCGSNDFNFFRIVEDPRNGWLMSESIYDDKKQLMQETINIQSNVTIQDS